MVRASQQQLRESIRAGSNIHSERSLASHQSVQYTAGGPSEGFEGGLPLLFVSKVGLTAITKHYSNVRSVHAAQAVPGQGSPSTLEALALGSWILDLASSLLPPQKSTVQALCKGSNPYAPSRDSIFSSTHSTFSHIQASHLSRL
ncbi:hypothetical protein WAI453_012642 [Rhynchosporium graminicola]